MNKPTDNDISASVNVEYHGDGVFLAQATAGRGCWHKEAGQLRAHGSCTYRGYARGAGVAAASAIREAVEELQKKEEEEIRA